MNFFIMELTSLSIEVCDIKDIYGNKEIKECIDVTKAKVEKC